MNLARNQENSQTTSQTPINLQQEYICYHSSEGISNEELAKKFNQLDYQERLHLKIVRDLCLQEDGICYASTAYLEALGAGCRRKQKLTRKKLQSLGLLTTYDRIEWGTKFRRTPLQRVADFLLDEAYGYMLKMFLGVAFFFSSSVLNALKSPLPKRPLAGTVTAIFKEIIFSNSSSYSSSIDIVRREENNAKDEKMSEYEENQNLKREDHKPENNKTTYGGTRLYDRKTSQKEVDLLAEIRERQRKINAEYLEKKAMLNADKESQPRFDEPKPKQPIRVSSNATEDPIEVSSKFSAWMETEDYKRKVALFGSEVMFKMCGKVVHNLLEGDF